MLTSKAPKAGFSHQEPKKRQESFTNEGQHFRGGAEDLERGELVVPGALGIAGLPVDERQVPQTGGLAGVTAAYRLLQDGHDVLCVDNFYTSTRRNITLAMALLLCVARRVGEGERHLRSFESVDLLPTMLDLRPALIGPPATDDSASSRVTLRRLR